MFGVASSDDTKIYECLRCGHVETRARKKSKAVSLGGLLRERAALMPSSRITCRSINLRHVVVTDGSCVTVVPIYCDATPGGSDDRALVFNVAVPADAISDL